VRGAAAAGLLDERRELCRQVREKLGAELRGPALDFWLSNPKQKEQR
jgi:hypothetical protein